MFTVAEREDVSARLLARAQADDSITAAAITGTLADGAGDEWSDVDLSFRLALPSVYARGADRVPDELKASLEPALVRSLDATELRRAREAAALAFLAELRHVGAPLAEALGKLF
jgi:hypothetical protein